MPPDNPIRERLPRRIPQRTYASAPQADPKPVGPRPVLARLVNKRLTNIEENRLDHPRILPATEMVGNSECDQCAEISQ
jgi:hypothetical protein